MAETIEARSACHTTVRGGAMAFLAAINMISLSDQAFARAPSGGGLIKDCCYVPVYVAPPLPVVVAPFGVYVR